MLTCSINNTQLFHTGLLPKLPFKFGSSDRDKGGGITLISARGINSDDVPSSEGGITLISKRKLDTGLDFDGKKVYCTFSVYFIGRLSKRNISTNITSSILKSYSRDCFDN